MQSECKMQKSDFNFNNKYEILIQNNFLAPNQTIKK